MIQVMNRLNKIYVGELQSKMFEFKESMYGMIWETRIFLDEFLSKQHIMDIFNIYFPPSLITRKINTSDTWDETI